jgi:predicted ATPase/class 3 adenylate cyclase/DNA-binding CsgD family transcriptional regulator
MLKVWGQATRTGLGDTAEVGERPSGTVTFLFTDVEGSTASWERHPDAMRGALGLHDEIVRSAIGGHDGVVFATAGDGFAAAFARAHSAVDAAIEAQVALAAADWPAGLSLKVRMGLHTGEGHERGGDYFGSAVNRAARVLDAANGSQILVSSSTREVLGGDVDASSVLVDLGVHELRDVVDPVRLYRLDDAAFESDPRPPRTGSVRAGNLRATSGSLLGRAEDVESVMDDLARARVVTLTGVGGIGKTRLALEVGRKLQGEWRDGVWFAALDTVDRPAALLRSLLGLLGIDPRVERELDSLIEGLKYRDTLLILDNCEHLLEAVAETASAIVSSCVRVRVLATSREPLDVDGERARRVGPLSTDEVGSAVELFRLRAEEAGASLDADRDADAIVRICRRLDGIPLAIELAAARARSLRPAEIAERLDDMFRLLTGGRRASTERHRTLRATLEWSYDLLSEPERSVFARLSIFPGSFALDAAEVVVADALSDDDVLDVIDRLLARSLLVPVDECDETRFRLLDPVRQLAGEQLATRGETDSFRRAHTRWYLDLIARLGERWRAGDDQGTWPIAARELPNFRVAFDHLVEAGRVDDAQRFAVFGYGPIGCHFDSVPMYDWAPRAGSLDPEHVGPWTASVYAVAAWGAILQDDLVGAAAWLGRAVVAIEVGSTDEGLVAAAAIHHVLSGGELAVSNAFLNRSVEAALQSADLHRQVWVLNYAGRFEEALDAALLLGNKLLIASVRYGMAALTTDGRDEELELFWEAAQQTHSYLMVNHAAMELGAAQVRAGAALDGLLLLRSPARDWLLRADARVWVVLHSMAMGFIAIGEVETAARLAGAIGERRLPFVNDRQRELLRSQLDESLDGAARARYETAGSTLDAGMAVAEALQRIEARAARSSDDSAVSDVDPSDLTARQLEVAKLVAQGFTNKRVAQQLGISRFTAETHVRNILGRLGAASRSEIATWVARQAALDTGAGSGTRAHT